MNWLKKLRSRLTNQDNSPEESFNTIIMSFTELCDLRDKLIMSDELSDKEKDYLYGHFVDAILNMRTVA